MSKTMELLSSETSIDDPYTLACPRTEEELKTYRAVLDAALQVHGSIVGDTCDGCARRYRCVLVFDPYNTNGDCLYAK